MISPWSPMKSPAFRFVLWQNHQLRRPSSSGLRCDVRQAKSRFSLNVPDQRQGMPSDRSTGPKSILWKKNFGSFGSTKTRKIALLRKLEVGHIYVVNHAKPLKFNFLKIVKTKSDLYSKQHILYWPTALPIAKFHSPTQNMTPLSQRSSPYFYCELNGMIPFFFSMVELELAWVSTKMSKCVNTQWCTIDCQVVSNKHISYIYIDVGWVYSVVYLELLLGFKVNQLIFLMRLISPVQPSQGQNEGFTFGARCPGAPLTMHLGVGALCSPWILCCILGEERDFIGFYMVFMFLRDLWGFYRVVAHLQHLRETYPATKLWGAAFRHLPARIFQVAARECVISPFP